MPLNKIAAIGVPRSCIKKRTALHVRGWFRYPPGTRDARTDAICLTTAPYRIQNSHFLFRKWCILITLGGPTSNYCPNAALAGGLWPSDVTVHYGVQGPPILWSSVRGNPPVVKIMRTRRAATLDGRQIIACMTDGCGTRSSGRNYTVGRGSPRKQLSWQKQN